MANLGTKAKSNLLTYMARGIMKTQVSEESQTSHLAIASENQEIPHTQLWLSCGELVQAKEAHILGTRHEQVELLDH